MRPSDLNFFFAPVASVRGVGPKTVPLLDRLVGRSGQPARVLDLLLHLPLSTVDRRARPKIMDAPREQVVVIEGRVVSHRPPGGTRGKGPYRVLVEDDTGDVTLVFFLNNVSWVEKALPLGATRWISGKLEVWDGHLQMVHPDRVMTAGDLAVMPAVEPVYGLTEGLYPRLLSKAIETALERLPTFPEWLEPNRTILRGWPSFADAVRALHHPLSPDAVEPHAPALQRLAYDELLASQFALAAVRGRMRDTGGRPTVGTGVLAARIEATLPFRLTEGQSAALKEIRADMASAKRMLRLLQGDVGSGKTIVALLAMATAIEAGHQAALMVPTEILARQHFERLSPLCGRARAIVAQRRKTRLATGSVALAATTGVAAVATVGLPGGNAGAASPGGVTLGASASATAPASPTAAAVPSLVAVPSAAVSPPTVTASPTPTVPPSISPTPYGSLTSSPTPTRTAATAPPSATVSVDPGAPTVSPTVSPVPVGSAAPTTAAAPTTRPSAVTAACTAEAARLKTSVEGAGYVSADPGSDVIAWSHPAGPLTSLVVGVQCSPFSPTRSRPTARCRSSPSRASTPGCLVTSAAASSTWSGTPRPASRSTSSPASPLAPIP